MLDFASQFDRGLSYHDFLARYGNAEHSRRWGAFYERAALTPQQQELLAGFRRQMKVLVLAGAWCGDCVEQCPIFQRFAEAAHVLDIRYLDRDEHADLQAALQICGGNRVPVVVFLSEEGHFVGLYGDRTLARYRKLASEQLGASCPTGLVPPTAEFVAAVVQEWLDQFERVQWLLRLSSRLRQLHGD